MCKVSAVIITFNEEYNLSRLLPRLNWCEEIVVVDSGSTDATLQLCKKYNCRVYYRKFDGYGSQKKYALSLALYDWILFLDADELLSNELVQEIQQELRHPSALGYYIPMSLMFMGKEFRFGKESGRYFLRLFDKRAGDFSEDKVHERIIVEGICKKLRGRIYHYSYRNFSQYFDKFNRYSSYGAEMYYEKGKKKSVLSTIFAIPLNFLKYYLLERNFLNGLAGFYWSVLCSFYHFAKYIKLREMYGQAGESKTIFDPGNSFGVKTLSKSKSLHSDKAD